MSGAHRLWAGDSGPRRLALRLAPPPRVGFVPCCVLLVCRLLISQPQQMGAGNVAGGLAREVGECGERAARRRPPPVRRCPALLAGVGSGRGSAAQGSWEGGSPAPRRWPQELLRRPESARARRPGRLEGQLCGGPAALAPRGAGRPCPPRGQGRARLSRSARGRCLLPRRLLPRRRRGAGVGWEEARCGSTLSPHHPGHALVLPLTVGPCTASSEPHCLSVKQGVRP